MMKIWLYSTILWLTSLFIGCDNVAVGYLYTNEASYSMDTLQVTRFSALENNIRELKRIFDQYTPEIQDLLAKRINWKRNLFLCRNGKMSCMKLINRQKLPLIMHRRQIKSIIKN